MMRYVSIANFRAPFDDVPFAGLGAMQRRYWDVSNFRAPYDQGYYQNNQLFGLGAVAPSTSVAELQRLVGADQTGQLDEQTQRHVASKQRELGLPATGWPDARLLQALGVLRVSSVPKPGVIGALEPPLNQIPRWAYGVAAAGLLLLAYKTLK
jgi:hypothetical protein